MTCSFVLDIFSKLWLSSFVSSQEGGQVAGDMSLSLSTAECGQESAWRVKFRRICFSGLGNFVRDPFRSFRCNDHFPHRFMGYWINCSTEIPSLQQTNITMENHHVSWVIPLWPTKFIWFYSHFPVPEQLTIEITLDRQRWRLQWSLASSLLHWIQRSPQADGVHLVILGGWHGSRVLCIACTVIYIYIYI